MAKLTASADVSDFLDSPDKEDARIALESEKLVLITQVSAATSYELPIPSGTPVLGDKAKFYIYANGAAGTSPCDLTLEAGIRIPSDSGITFPKVIAYNETYIAQLEYLGSFWMLTTLIGGAV